jgi:multicomponent Na+:H+ antiporter subunit E
VTSLLANLVLAFVWAAALGSLSLAHWVSGFVVGAAILALLPRPLGGRSYSRRLVRGVGLILFFVGQLVVSSLRVAADVLTPRHRARPGVVGVPLDARSDAEISLLANLISLTPGSLSLDVSPDRRTLYVHVMFIDDVERVRREIKDGFERRVLELLR